MPDQHDVLVLRRWHTCPMTSAIQGNAINERNTETLGNICWCKNMGDKGWLVGFGLVGCVGGFQNICYFRPYKYLGK